MLYLIAVCAGVAHFFTTGPVTPIGLGVAAVYAFGWVVFVTTLYVVLLVAIREVYPPARKYETE